jgi:hypothetical protein
MLGPERKFFFSAFQLVDYLMVCAVLCHPSWLNCCVRGVDINKENCDASLLMI